MDADLGGETDVPRTREEKLADLVRQLLTESKESEWLEFKRDNTEPTAIGEYASALSNGAALTDREFGYLIWGIEDETRSVVGTTFRPTETKVGNEDLIPWLVRHLDQDVDLRFDGVTLHGEELVVLTVRRAIHRPTRFKQTAYIRVGSYKKPLHAHPEIEPRLWRQLQSAAFETEIVTADCSAEEVLGLLDHPLYYQLMNRPQPTNATEILDDLRKERLIRRDDAGRWEVTMMGAILFARSLADFESLERKRLRIVRYNGSSRVSPSGETLYPAGYASSLVGALGDLHQILPSNEVIREALREAVPMYPSDSLRELLVNALIHQDFGTRGQGPMIEVFDGRLEISNPGAPLVDRLRLIDSPPRSRNEALAAFMRRIGFCEERGSGWDKVASEVEFHQLPAPLVEVVENNTRVSLYAHKELRAMDAEERVRAVYIHSCLRQITNRHTNNESIRKRFGIAKRNAATASKLLNDAVSVGLIKIYDPTIGRKNTRYVPFWVSSPADE